MSCETDAVRKRGKWGLQMKMRDDYRQEREIREELTKTETD